MSSIPSSTIPTYTQTTLTLPPFPRGSHLITDFIVDALSSSPAPASANSSANPGAAQNSTAVSIGAIRTGLLHLFLQHTSAALSLNENWDEDVRADMSDALDGIVGEDEGGKKGIYRHNAEGDDDMPAHIKSSLIGASISIPISNGKLALGTWQGIWFLEFRNVNVGVGAGAGAGAGGWKSGRGGWKGKGVGRKVVATIQGVGF